MRLPIVLAACCLATTVAGQTPADRTPAGARTRTDEQFWLNLTVQGSIRERLIYFAEVQPRAGNGMADPDQLILRPAIGWKLSDSLSAYQGYARMVSLAGADRREDRGFQQLSWTIGRIGPGDASLRARLEQRWRSDGRDTGWRARALARYRLPLRRDRTGVALLASVEPFVALNGTDWGVRRGFDQVRGFVGVELPAGGGSTAELGYLNQYVDGGGGARRVNHVASVTVFVRP